MITVTLAKTLKRRGKTLYWLSKTTGLRYSTVHRLATKEVKKIDLAILEKLARALDCGLADLLVMTDEE